MCRKHSEQPSLLWNNAYIKRTINLDFFFPQKEAKAPAVDSRLMSVHPLASAAD